MRRERYQQAMLPTTLRLLRTALEADPSISARERNKMLAALRTDPTANRETTATERVSRLVRRAEAARRLGVSVRTVDKLAASGVLPRRTLPGRVRASGFLESDLSALVTAEPRKEAA